MIAFVAIVKAPSAAKVASPLTVLFKNLGSVADPSCTKRSPALGAEIVTSDAPATVDATSEKLNVPLPFVVSA